MPRVTVFRDKAGNLDVVGFECPGCKVWHQVPVKGAESAARHDDPRPRWDWNGSTAFPTLAPSLLVGASREVPRCHSHVRDGRIEFLSDCDHQLAGQTVDLPEAQP